MNLADALPILEASCNIRFGELFKNLPVDLKTNKGNVGQLIELHIGLSLNSELTDFEDGELKTNKADEFGMPRETMFITQISGMFDDLISTPPLSFEETKIYQKIRNLIFLPVVKDSPNSSDWYFTACYHVQIPVGSDLFNSLKLDYATICAKISTNLVSGDGFIHTTTGDLIQIRSKDSKPYHPIFSNSLNRYVSNKNHAFYFKKKFMENIVRIDN